MVPEYFTTSLSTSARPTLSTRKLLAWPPLKSMLKRSASEPGTMKLGPIGFSKKPGNDTTIVSFGTKGGETDIFRKDGKGLLKKFTDKSKTSLGPEAESLIAQDNEEIRENRQRLREAEKQLRDAEKLASEREKAAQEVQDLRIRIERTQASIDQLGSNVESESELRRLQQLKKIIKRILKMQKKRWRLSRNKLKPKPKNKPGSINLEKAWQPKRAKETQ